MFSSIRWFRYGRLIFPFAVFLVLTGVPTVGVPADDLDKSLKQFRILIEILDKIQQEYVDPTKTSTEDLLNGAIHGMVSSLDHYSVYMNKDESKEFNEQTSGTFSGLGIQIDIVDGWLTVIEPLPETPAAKAGIIGGDRIIEINGESTKGISIFDAQKQLKGDPGSKVSLTIARAGEADLLTVEITRAVIHTFSIDDGEKKLLDSTIGYIRLRDFTKEAATELESAIRDLESRGMTGLILDLRDNVGGLLDVAVSICDLFIPEKEVLVSHRDQKNRVKTYYAEREPIGHFLLAVLVNEYSASASEIVAGCIQDHHRGVLVGPMGHKTFGKGSVQTLIDLKTLSGASLKITTAKYYTPAGRSIDDEKGLTPDLFAPVTDEQRQDIRRAGKIGFIPPRLLANSQKPGVEQTANLPTSATEVFQSDKGESGDSEDELYDVELYTAYQCIKGAEALRIGSPNQYSLVHPGN